MIVPVLPDVNTLQYSHVCVFKLVSKLLGELELSWQETGPAAAASAEGGNARYFMSCSSQRQRPEPNRSNHHDDLYYPTDYCQKAQTL